MRKLTGFTLVEIVVVLSIVVLVSSVTFGAIRVYDLSLTMAGTKSQLAAQANMALNKMKEELSQSASSTITVFDDILAIKIDAVYFQIPTGLDDEQNIQWGNGITEGKRILYFVGADYTEPKDRYQLVRDTEESSNSLTVLGDYITNLQITPVSPPYDSLTLTVTASRAAQRGVIPAVSVTASTTVDFKN